MLKIEDVKKGKYYIGTDDETVKKVTFVGHELIVYEYIGLSSAPGSFYETSVCHGAFLTNNKICKKPRGDK